MPMKTVASLIVMKIAVGTWMGYFQIIESAMLQQSIQIDGQKI